MIRISLDNRSTTPARSRAAGGVALAFGAASLLALSGCGATTPTRADFIDEMRSTLGSDLATGAGLDIDAGRLATIVDDFLGCTYDAIKGDESLLTQMMKDPSFSSATTDDASDLQARLGQLTTECTTELNNAATEVPSGEE